MKVSVSLGTVVPAMCACGLLLLAQQGGQPTGAQSQPTEKPESLQDVKHGTPIEDVLAGLRKHYNLKEDEPGLFWTVTSKDETSSERGVVTAANGRVNWVAEEVLPDTLAGDSASLVRALFRELYINTHPLPGDAVHDEREGVATLKLNEFHVKGDDWQELHLWVGKKHYIIDLHAPDGAAPYVKFSKMW